MDTYIHCCYALLGFVYRSAVSVEGNHTTSPSLLGCLYLPACLGSTPTRGRYWYICRKLTLALSHVARHPVTSRWRDCCDTCVVKSHDSILTAASPVSDPHTYRVSHPPTPDAFSYVPCFVFDAVGALFRTSLACAPEKSVDDPEMEVESLSPRRAAAQAAFQSTPFAKVTLDPPSLEMLLDQKPLQSSAVTIANSGGVKGKFHVREDSLPKWMRLEGSDKGELGPGETVKIGLVVDVAAAEAAAEEERNGQSGPRQACAMLMVEVDGGGSGTFLPVVGTFSGGV